MILKYRAYIDGEFYYFDLLELIEMAEVDAVACTLGKNQPNKKILKWLNKGNQPDVFTGYKDKKGKDVYTNDIHNGYFKPQAVSFKNEEGFISNYDWIGFKKLLIELPKEFKIIGNLHQNKDLLNDN
jgi:hypothetical protein